MTDQHECTKPPEGWYCTRPHGHRGPCAAWPTEVCTTLDCHFQLGHEGTCMNQPEPKLSMWQQLRAWWAY